jgi:CubicO group peptidase (beta-lactamase class C family)
MTEPLALADLQSSGFDPKPIARLEAMIQAHIAEGRYPGCQIALARRGKLALFKTFGQARSASPAPARDDTLWLLYSNTKVITMAALWSLVEDGKLAFTDRIAEHVPEFAARGKGGITVMQVATHQAGFPTAAVSKEAWADHKLLRQQVCDFALEWTPGSRVHYHGLSAHWTIAVLIEAITGQDFRQVIRERVIAPLGLEKDLFVGLPPSEHARAADMHQPEGPSPFPPGTENSAAFREAGIPGGGGYGTARAMATLYQMLGHGGRLGKVRLFSPRMIQYVTRNRTGDRVDEFMGMPMHRGLGPHSRGLTDTIRGLGSLAAPETFGHGGVGSSYCWADPTSGVSFAYLTNFRQPDPWHSARLDKICNFVHSAID